MIEILMPDGAAVEIKYVVFDYNGTLAVDGLLSGQVKHLLRELANKAEIKVITADTFGLARAQLEELPEVELVILKEGEGGLEKEQFVRSLGADTTAVVGNGVNDRQMFMVAKLAVGVIGREGASFQTLSFADIVVNSPEDAINLFLTSKRIVATLRR